MVQELLLNNALFGSLVTNTLSNTTRGPEFTEVNSRSRFAVAENINIFSWEWEITIEKTLIRP